MFPLNGTRSNSPKFWCWQDYLSPLHSWGLLLRFSLICFQAPNLHIKVTIFWTFASGPRALAPIAKQTYSSCLALNHHRVLAKIAKRVSFVLVQASPALTRQQLLTSLLVSSRHQLLQYGCQGLCLCVQTLDDNDYLSLLTLFSSPTKFLLLSNLHMPVCTHTHTHTRKHK